MIMKWNNNDNEIIIMKNINSNNEMKENNENDEKW